MVIFYIKNPQKHPIDLFSLEDTDKKYRLQFEKTFHIVPYKETYKK